MNTLKCIGGGAVVTAFFVIAIVLVGGAYIAVFMFSPGSVSIVGPDTIPMGGGGQFKATVTFKDALTSERTMHISFLEDDYIGNNMLEEDVLLTVKSGKKSGSATVTLDCTSNGLEGDDGYASTEDPYHVYAIHDRPFPMTNVESTNQVSRCVEAE